MKNSPTVPPAQFVAMKQQQGKGKMMPQQQQQMPPQMMNAPVPDQQMPINPQQQNITPLPVPVQTPSSAVSAPTPTTKKAPAKRRGKNSVSKGKDKSAASTPITANAPTPAQTAPTPVAPPPAASPATATTASTATQVQQATTTGTPSSITSNNTTAASPELQQFVRENDIQIQKEMKEKQSIDIQRMKRRELAKDDPSAYFLATLADTFNLHEEEQNVIETAKAKKNNSKLPGTTNGAAHGTSADSPFQHGLTPSAILQTPLPFTAKTPGSVLPSTQNYEDDKSKNNYSWTGRVKAGVISNVFKEVIDG
ncbi:unnamed protein product [[Candida] boidinii]|nr:unnamed protein product [[Candida] boidinii]